MLLSLTNYPIPQPYCPRPRRCIFEVEPNHDILGRRYVRVNNETTWTHMCKVDTSLTRRDVVNAQDTLCPS